MDFLQFSQKEEMLVSLHELWPKEALRDLDTQKLEAGDMFNLGPIDACARHLWSFLSPQ